MSVGVPFRGSIGADFAALRSGCRGAGESGRARFRVSGRISKNRYAEDACVKINQVIWYEQFVDKLQVKHHVEIDEAEEALQNRRRVRRVKRGHVKGEDVYLALGQTDAGRYLSEYFVYMKTHDAIVISPRDMDDEELAEYEKS